MPAARVGDTISGCEDGSDDTINAGSSCVMFNGKPAARIGDSTEHGGKITEGSVYRKQWRHHYKATKAGKAIDITTKRSKLNLQTNLTRAELEKNLKKSGFIQTRACHQFSKTYEVGWIRPVFCAVIHQNICFYLVDYALSG